MGIARIKRNQKKDTADVVEYCKNKVLDKIVIYTNSVKIGKVRKNPQVSRRKNFIFC